jgi:hypothetical protein
MKIRTIDGLQSLIDNEIEESTVLDYKSTIDKNKPSWKEELAKDVSAMANANGGVIIYGIMEKAVGKGHSVPEKLTPISNTLMSKDSFSQLLSSNIQPVIENVEINYIPYNDQSGFFVVEVPQGITAHQNRLSHQYHRRRNAIIEAMEDYEIRDVMNRSKHPVIEMEFELHKTITEITEKPRRNILNEPLSEDKHYTETKCVLKYRLVNKGKMYAHYINYFIYFPLELLHDNEKDYVNIDSTNNLFNVFGNNTVRDLTAVKGLSHEYGPSRYDPILPGLKGRQKSVELNWNGVDDILLLPPFVYCVMADNAPERKRVVEWKDIKLFEETKSVTRDPYNIQFNPILFK